MNFSLSRRAFAASAALLPIACNRAADATLGGDDKAAVADPLKGPINPLVKNRADSQVFRHEDGNYYLTGSVPEYDRLILRRSKTLAGLATAEERVLWRHEKTGPMSGFLWAPELHLIDGKWVMYFAAGPSGGGEDVFRIRTYAIVCDGSDPMTGKWSVLGEFKMPWDSFNLDSTSFVHKGQRYFAWAQREEGIDTNSNLYIAPMKDALTLSADPVRLTVPTLDWETRAYKVAEAPAVLAKNGRLFMTYSASGTGAVYCLGMLTIDENANLMDPKAWTKSQKPVFATCVETSVYGPGHNSFTVDENGNDILVYHGRDYEKIEGDPLLNPDRHTRVQRIYYDDKGAPDFGVPVGNGALPERFTPAVNREVMLGHDGTKLTLAKGTPLPRTQFREIAGADGAVQLSPILLRDKGLAVGKDGVAALTALGTADLFLREAGEVQGTVRFVSKSDSSKALAFSGDAVKLADKGDPATSWLVG
ncbi:glycoside hydrolase family 43 protein [Novosphingobium sp. ST904]|uniref:glycoside hydrolase family 43 protein n=1 Tax=Novosphingobium sp. ST904 TaxID=1684385 RepID=UPI0006C84E12|nr:glycoside hydrolase family 43 protein [Novosphingobium sp. ST904]KPH64503.1 arabinofuranosidase [Novosphingobium sp. ST904]TCM31153.1 GH43 family beta-xylosidase [Novosphingobium sp. ST904]